MRVAMVWLNVIAMYCQSTSSTRSTTGVQDAGVVDVKVLTGERVGLRAPRLDDAEELFASVASDPEVTRYMSWTPHPDVDETRRVITELFNVGGERTWLIEMRDSGQIIGTCGFQAGPAPQHGLRLLPRPAVVGPRA